MNIIKTTNKDYKVLSMSNRTVSEKPLTKKEIDRISRELIEMAPPFGMTLLSETVQIRDEHVTYVSRQRIYKKA